MDVFSRSGGLAMPATNSGKVELLALAVARGESVVDAAKAHGINERTAYRWSAEPEFKAQVDELRRRMVADAVGMLARSATRAVATLEELMGGAAPPTVRLGAARAILASLIEIQAHAELTGRIAALERRIDEQKTGR
jgi:hypothetical protein